MSVTTITEMTVVERWIFNVIAADADLKVGGTLGVRQVANTEVRGTNPWPAIVFNPTTTMKPTRGVGLTKLWSAGPWMIKVICKTANYDDCEPFAARIHQLFDKAGGAVAGGGYIVSSHETDTFQMPERVSQDEQYRHMGYTYRIVAQQP
jgi:hypothetical protein